MRVLVCLFLALGSMTLDATVVRVGILPHTMPFTGFEKGKLTGILGEAWTKISHAHGWTSMYIPLRSQELEEVEELLKKVDVVLAPQAQWLLPGLRYSEGLFLKEMGIMQLAVGTSFGRILKENWDALSLSVISLGLLLLVFSAIGVYYQQYRFSEPFSKESTLQGICRSIYACAMQVVGVGLIYPLYSLRANWSLAPLVGTWYAVLAILSGVIGASYTVNVLAHRIVSVGDLVGKNIALVETSLFETQDMVSTWGSYEHVVSSIEEGMALAQQHLVDGIIAPIAELENYADFYPHHHFIVSPLDLKPIVLALPFSPTFVHGDELIAALRDLQANFFMNQTCRKYFQKGGAEQCLT